MKIEGNNKTTLTEQELIKWGINGQGCGRD